MYISFSACALACQKTQTPPSLALAIHYCDRAQARAQSLGLPRASDAGGCGSSRGGRRGRRCARASNSVGPEISPNDVGVTLSLPEETCGLRREYTPWLDGRRAVRREAIAAAVSGGMEEFRTIEAPSSLRFLKVGNKPFSIPSFTTSSESPSKTMIRILFGEATLKINGGSG